MKNSTHFEELRSPIESFYHWESTTPNNIFLRQPFGDTWKTMTYAEAGLEARRMTTALQAMGLKKGDHIGIFSKNCYHWMLADIAIMMGGYVSIPYYSNLPKDTLNEILQKSDARALFVGKLDDWGGRAEGIPDNVQVIKFPYYEGNAKVDIGAEWSELIQQHDPIEGQPCPSHDELWTILYTSGTTGSPKGAMFNHKTPAMIMDNERKTNWMGLFKYDNHKYFSFLPLNHVAERMGVQLPCIYFGGSISFAESLTTFAKNLQETQPTSIFAVPRIWTKFYLGVVAKMPQKKMDLLLKIPIVSGMVKKKLKTALGLRDAKIVATGAAITPAYLKEWYKKLDLHLCEAYGMTEVGGSFTNGPSKDTPYDSVGAVVPGCEVKIDPDTQEILMKTPFVMLGYYKDPEKTAEVLRDGWIYSGDRGTLDENGYLRVIGRVKDAFKTSKGEYITPNPIEEKFANNDFVEQVCLCGMTIPQPVALVNLSEIGMAADRGDVEKALFEDLQRINKGLKNHERVSTIVVNKEAWSMENGLLTPTLKVRRGKVDECYCDKYEAWHEAELKVIWES